MSARRQARLHRNLKGVDAQAARLVSVAAPGAHEWMSALPTREIFKFSPEQWTVNVALRLGTVMPGFPTTRPPTCVCSTRVDSDCHHMFRCPHGNERQATHDAVAYEVKKLFEAAGSPTTREPYHFYVGTNKRPDLVIRSGWVLGSNLQHTADIAVVHPCLPSFARAAARYPLSAANRQAKRKSTKYATYNTSHGIARLTLPFLFEVFGGAAAETSAHIRTLTDRIHGARPFSPGFMRAVTHTYWTRRIVCTLAKGVADGINRRLCRAFTNGDRPPPDFISRAGGFAPDPLDRAAVHVALRAAQA